MAGGAVFIIDLADARPVDREALAIRAKAAGIEPLRCTGDGTLWVVYRDMIRYSSSMSMTMERHPGVPILYVYEAMRALA